MGQTLETLAQQTRAIPTIVFYNPESVSYRIGEERDGMELEELPSSQLGQDEDSSSIDRFP